MIRPSDIAPLSEFVRNAKATVAQVKETRRPFGITINGRAEVVLLDAGEYEDLVDELERLKLSRDIAEAEAQIAAGKWVSMEDMLAKMDEKLDAYRKD